MKPSLLQKVILLFLCVAILLLVVALWCSFSPKSAKVSLSSLPIVPEKKHFSLPNAFSESLSAKAAVLITDKGEILYAKNEDEKRGMASTTKIMTALLAAEYMASVGEDAVATIGENAVGIEGSSVYLKVGERVRLMDLLYATMLASANDAAFALAEVVAGSAEAFVSLMNERAKEMGLVATHFENPHGLHSEGHYTTAYELAILASCAMQNSLFSRVAATKSYSFSGEGMTRSFANHNRMLRSYEGAVGIKTGFTKATGRCLVTAAERQGVRLLAVTLDAPSDWRDHTALLDYGFTSLCRVSLAKAGDFSTTLGVVGGERESVRVTCESDCDALLPKTHGKIRCEYEMAHFVFAPIDKGQVLGRLVFYENEKEIAYALLVAEEAVPAKVYQRGLGERLLSFFGLK